MADILVDFSKNAAGANGDNGPDQIVLAKPDQCLAQSGYHLLQQHPVNMRVRRAHFGCLQHFCHGKREFSSVRYIEHDGAMFGFMRQIRRHKLGDKRVPQPVILGALLGNCMQIIVRWYKTLARPGHADCQEY